MKIIFGYYEDEDFGLTPYPDIPYLIRKNLILLKNIQRKKKIGEYTKF